MKRSLLVTFALLAILAALLILAAATGAGPAVPLTGAPSVVSYQGQVVMSGIPYSGNGYFKFAIVDAAGTTSFWSNDGTSSSGSEPTASVPLAVANGLFSVLLGDTALPGMTQALDATAFASTDRGLRVWFGTDNATFTQLVPDRRIAAVPYALQAQEAANAAVLEGYPASAFQQKPAGVVMVAKSGGDFTTVTDALNSITDASDTNRYLVRVAPGVYTETVTMKPYVDIEGAGELLTRIVYASTVYTTAVTGKPSVDVEGIGDWLTWIVETSNIYTDTAAMKASASGKGTDNPPAWNLEGKGIRPGSRKPPSAMVADLSAKLPTGVEDSSVSITLRGASHAELRFLTVENTSYSDYSVAIYNAGASPRLTHVTAVASNGTYSSGVQNEYWSQPIMVYVSAAGIGGTYNHGVLNYASDPIMMQVTALGYGGATNSTGVYNDNASPVMTDVIATGRDGYYNCGVVNIDSASQMQRVTASGLYGNAAYGIENSGHIPDLSMNQVIASGIGTGIGEEEWVIGVYNHDEACPIMNYVKVYAFGGNAGTSGLYNWDSSAYIRNSSISAESWEGIGITNYSTGDWYYVTLDNSEVDGWVAAISSDPKYGMFIGATLLDNQVYNNGGYIEHDRFYRLNADTLDGLHASEFQRDRANVLVVAESGGDFTTITDALDSITDASDTHRYLVQVAPGVYTETVTMKPYVDIEGAGELLTRITYAGSASSSTGTVVGASNAELRSLTIENTGGADHATAVYNSGASLRLTRVTASASGGASTNRAVANFTLSSATMTDVTALASGGAYATGVLNDASSPTMTRVTTTATDATSYNRGIQNIGASPTMSDVTASATGYGAGNCGVFNLSSSPAMNDVNATASEGTDNYGIYNDGSAPVMMRVTATASGGSGSNCGVYNYQSSPEIRNSTIGAGGATGSRYGIFNERVGTSGAYTVTVDSSQVTGSTNTIYNDSYFTVRVGASKLAGGSVWNTLFATVTCAGVYDEDYVFYASTCP